MQDAEGTIADLRMQLKGALRSRALLMAALLDELEPALGAERAEALLTRAMHGRGEAAGRRFLADCAPADFERLRTRFIDILPDHGGLFEIETTRCDAGGLGLQFRSCPVKEAYEEAGRSWSERMRTEMELWTELGKASLFALGFLLVGYTTFMSRKHKFADVI